MPIGLRFIISEDTKNRSKYKRMCLISGVLKRRVPPQYWAMRIVPRTTIHLGTGVLHCPATPAFANINTDPQDKYLEIPVLRQSRRIVLNSGVWPLKLVYYFKQYLSFTLAFHTLGNQWYLQSTPRTFSRLEIYLIIISTCSTVGS